MWRTWCCGRRKGSKRWVEFQVSTWRNPELNGLEWSLTGWWFGTFFIFPYGIFIIPTDELIFFRGVAQPPTSWSCDRILKWGQFQLLASSKRRKHVLLSMPNLRDNQSRDHAGWWFGTFFICPYIGNNHPNWPIFFRGVQTTNQKMTGWSRSPFLRETASTLRLGRRNSF